ncbi:GDP-mannose 4,6-dehydratase [Candidatus Hakubella thermalkaliphila]|nr:GDP-mannose 4,6-dehydratase [Candidatus Hakubella thermalkaliphila]
MEIRRFLIIGGAGFIGSNVVAWHLQKGDEVIVFDNLSRPGAERNLTWLRDLGNITFVKGDVRDYGGVLRLFRDLPNIDVVLHLAAQVAVTTSILDPRQDFEVNALGTLNILEAMRETNSQAILLYASTNKVYGDLKSVGIQEVDSRYVLKDLPEGISENQPLDFYSPYGCSKGAADQYVRDYARIYSLKTVVFRQSCIYGQRQFGMEDQGWVAWFAIAAVFGKPITIYGDGKQVRDVLFIDDLLEAFDRVVEHNETVQGQVYNIGGGPQNSISLLGLLGLLEDLLGRRIRHSFSDWRPGDQPVFISDNSKARRDFGWEPKVSVQDGVERLLRWVERNKELFEEVGVI